MLQTLAVDVSHVNVNMNATTTAAMRIIPSAVSTHNYDYNSGPID